MQAAIGVDRLEGDAALTVVEDRSLRVFQVEPLAQFPNDDNGELEALASVDGHDADHISSRCGDAAGVEVVARYADAVEIVQEACEALPLKFSEASGAFVELEQVGASLVALGETADTGQVAAFLVDFPEDVGDGAAPHAAAPVPDLHQDFAESRLEFRVGSLLGIATDGGVKGQMRR